MGDALVDTINGRFKLKEDEEGNRGCPKCGGQEFRCTLEPDTWLVWVGEDEGSYVDIGNQAPSPEVASATCTKCGFELEEEDIV